MRKPSSQEIEVLDALVEIARPIIRTTFNADSCIASTRIGMDAAAYFGIATREIPLLNFIMNAEAAALIASGTTMVELAAMMKTIPEDTEGGPWTIGLGAGAGTGWAGHLVIGAPQFGGVIDLSLDQASRPHKALVLRPYWTVVDQPDWWGFDPSRPDTGEPMATVATSDGTVMVLDRRAPDPFGYRQSPNWKRTTRGDRAVYRDLTGQIIREVRAALGR